tara:strand:+ start:247 stop:633 length:387 start_codon:yes stop_codon:yes gene_type:complete
MSFLLAGIILLACFIAKEMSHRSSFARSDNTHRAQPGSRLELRAHSVTERLLIRRSKECVAFSDSAFSDYLYFGPIDYFFCAVFALYLRTWTNRYLTETSKLDKTQKAVWKRESLFQHSGSASIWKLQ